MAAGVLSLTLARHLRIPGIILLLATGVGLGPNGIGWINPDLLGSTLNLVVGVAVAIILFEGGLHMDLGRLKSESSVINKLITLGSLVTAVLAGGVAWYFMKWGWELSVLFGTLVIVTGPTVVTPLLRRLRIQKKIATILEAEGVLIDPIGAIIAVAALDFVLASSDASVLSSLGTLAAKLAFGMAVGFVGGTILGWLLKQEKLVPDEFENILTLGIVLLIFEASNYFLHESGIMTVTMAGVVVGNMKIPMHRQMIDFKAQLTWMLIGLLFVLLAADVRLEHMQELGWAGVATVLGVIFFVRPLNILSCTIGSGLDWKEKTFLCWLAPRGIVAAAVASLFATDLEANGIAGGEQLRALVFMVILFTVVLQGFSAGPLATFLGLRRKTNDGYLIVGANVIGRLLAKQLSDRGEDIVLADSNTFDCSQSEKEGFQVIFGNALEEHILKRANVESKRGVIGMTPNEGVNLMLMRRVKDLDPKADTFLCLKAGSSINREMVTQAKGLLIFGGPIDYDLWSHRIRRGVAESHKFQLESDEYQFSSDPKNPFFGPAVDMMIPFTHRRKGTPVAPVVEGLKLKKGDVLEVIIYRDAEEQSRVWLGETGFKAWIPEEQKKEDPKGSPKSSNPKKL